MSYEVEALPVARHYGGANDRLAMTSVATARVSFLGARWRSRVRVGALGGVGEAWPHARRHGGAAAFR